MSDIGWTHVALLVADLPASIAFYEQYADLHVVHFRKGTDRPNSTRTPVAWLGDARRAFVLVLTQSAAASPALQGLAHLGVACATAQIVDERCKKAQAAGCLVRAPSDLGAPAGYCGFVADPDGNQVELSFGQEIARCVDDAWQASLHDIAS